MNSWRNKITGWLSSPPEATAFSAVDESAIAPLLLRIIKGGAKRPYFAVFPVATLAERAFFTVQNWNQEFNLNLKILYLPETLEQGRFIPENESERARTLYETLCKPFNLVIGSAQSFTAPAPPPDDILGKEIILKCGETINFNQLLTKLVELDYDDEMEVSAKGEFSRRGGIIDIFSPAYDYPARLEFWGDTIDSIRKFAPDTQRSLQEIDEYRIIPRAGMQTELETSGADFFSYGERLGAENILVYPEQCRERLNAFGAELHLDRFEAINATPKLYKLFSISSEAPDGSSPAKCYPATEHLRKSLSEELRGSGMDILRSLIADQIRQWLDSDYQIVMLGLDDSTPEHIEKWCSEYQISPKKITQDSAKLPDGLIFPSLKMVFLTEKELFTGNIFKRPDTMPMTRGKTLEPRPEDEAAAITDLAEGDHAVHLMYGIGIFRGIREMKHNGISRELIVMEYREGAMIYVPIWQAGLVSRYVGARHAVSLNSLTGKRWNETKLKAQKGIQEFAADMLRLSAMRNASQGIEYPEDDLDQRIFEDSFPFDDTPDQIKATAEIKADMSKSRPMDRLLCGDVGYGKTEVAIRAAFKAVRSGYQVAILVPTTILAQQHYYSFRERFAKYPYMIEMLSRFRSPKEQTEILKRIAVGGIDIIIGTHRLLGSDVKFHQLGLVVIDEEQRFGVKHKERLKRFRAEVDILTMSATPIPRTLYMAMTGVRDLSTIITAPGLRLPVQTAISADDSATVNEAILREVQRGGQVYYIHNRVKTIHGVLDKLEKMMPKVRFAVGHGQMDADELELIMSEFLSGNIDVLISTTIIESGLDVPNANTIIIERADRFGLAELYQLRGRVGRWNRQAYAYLLLPKDGILTDDARKRIAAIRRYSHLGAGFRLAMRDLEIRGSGNLLGAEQSGHINSIGFELYCRLLRQTIIRMEGGTESGMLPSVEFDIDFICFAHKAPSELLPLGFPPDYIVSERLRMDAYRRLAAFTEQKQLTSFEEELEDRFGKMPPQVIHILKLNRIRIAAARAGYTSINVKKGLVVIRHDRNIFKLNGIIPVISHKDPPTVQLDQLYQLSEKININYPKNSKS